MQRLGEYGAPDYNVLSKQTFIIIIPVMLQTGIFLSSWVFLAAYLKFYVVLCVVALMLINFAVLQTVIFKLGSKNKLIDASLDGVPDEKRENECRQIFFTAVLTSWISPLTVWSNNMTSNRKREQLEHNRLSKYFLSITSITSSLTLLLIILTSYAWITPDFVSSNANISSPTPLTYCFENVDNNSFSSNYSFCFEFVSCFSINDTVPRQRVCRDNESPNDFSRNVAVPAIVGALVVNALITLVMQFLGNYENLFRVSKALQLTIIHPTLINDYFIQALEELGLSPKAEKHLSAFKNILSMASEDVINWQNPITGDTCLHVAYRKGFLDEVQ